MSQRENVDQHVVQKHEAMMEAVRQILENVGEDPNRDGLIKTPHRVAKMFDELLQGYSNNLTEIVNGALYPEDYGNQEMVIIDNIEFNSMCEHHMLPFVGKAHVAYIPNSKIIGLSKIPRIIDMFAKRLQVQERLTNQIADAIEQVLDPLGVIVMLQGNHSCASLRGVKKSHVNMTTVALRNEFKTNRELRDEFYQLVKMGSK